MFCTVVRTVVLYVDLRLVLYYVFTVVRTVRGLRSTVYDKVCSSAPLAARFVSGTPGQAEGGRMGVNGSYL